VEREGEDSKLGSELMAEGALAFRREDFERHRVLFEGMKDGQRPHTLFLGCADSRVVPNLMTRTDPGEVFVVRNVANIVPPYRASEEYLATTSAIEYAVKALGVRNIVVCGHSNCGGCAALYLPEADLAEIPHTRNWLKLAEAAKARALEALGGEADPARREWLTEQANVVLQMGHALSYPFIREKVRSGEMTLSGWHYIIQTGEILAYERISGEFKLIN
jgi:carbonic anhydrase